MRVRDPWPRRARMVRGLMLAAGLAAGAWVLAGFAVRLTDQGTGPWAGGLLAGLAVAGASAAWFLAGMVVHRVLSVRSEERRRPGGARWPGGTLTLTLPPHVEYRISVGAPSELVKVAPDRWRVRLGREGIRRAAQVHARPACARIDAAFAEVLGNG